MLSPEQQIWMAKWNSLMFQRASFANILWNRVGAFSFISTGLITVSLVEAIKSSQATLTIILWLGLLLSMAFLLIGLRHNGHFRNIEDKIKEAESKIPELKFVTDLQYRWYQKAPIHLITVYFPVPFLAFWVFRFFKAL